MRLSWGGAWTPNQGSPLLMSNTVAPPTITEHYRDRHLLIVEKPTGLPTQGTRAGGDRHLFAILQTGERYVGLHHRLDTPASGLVLFTLDRRANAGIAKGFRTHQIHRGYQAAVVGDPGDSGTWDSQIDGKVARSYWQREQTREGISILRIRLETGRTHQIRRHAAYHGFPILGDRRHGGAAGSVWPRLALHAAELRLTHPITGKALVVRSEIPADLQALWDQARPRHSPKP
jgi:23S rRNA pseudouridine1911/1915/1917 synthase